MAWRLSRFRTGDLVQVRTREEILATLDEQGCFDRMPFMPEMLQFCGQRFRVGAVAHKTCDTVHKTGGRQLRFTVHLAGLRCDGSAHGGCQAECNLFWKDLWLKAANESDAIPADEVADDLAAHVPGCSEAQLWANARLPSSTEREEPRYSCQATKLYDATEPLASWDPRQYILDVVSGNRSTRRVLRVIWLGALRWLVHRVPFGYRLVKSFNDWMHKWLAGRASPSLHCRIERGKPTPTGRLDLELGDYVRIKLQEQIEHTLDSAGRNRGLGFEAEEMGAYCGRVARVKARVTRIIDEATGLMRQMKQPCIVLDGVICSGDWPSRRLNCPRAINAYWREIWLERVEVNHDSFRRKREVINN